MTRKRREREVVRWRERQGSQTEWKDRRPVRQGGRDSRAQVEASMGDQTDGRGMDCQKGGKVLIQKVEVQTEAQTRWTCR